MTLGKFAVERPVAVTMRIASLVLLGFICLLRLPIDLLPHVDVPTVAVNVNWPNTAPEVMEAQIARPIEEAVGTVRGLYLVSSSSSQGSTSVRVQFNYGTNIDQGAIDVLQVVERAQGRFPNDPTISIPQIFKFDPSTLPILIYGVKSSKTQDLVKLNDRLTNEISPIIESAGGVAAVTVSGGAPRSIMIDIDPAKLEAHGLAFTDVTKRLNQENISQPAGIAVLGKTQYNIQSVGYFKSLDEINNLTLGIYNGAYVRLRDVASLRDASQDILSYTRLNGEPAVVIAVTKQSTENTVTVTQNVEAAIKKVLQTNSDLSVTSVYNQAGFITKSIDDLKETAVIGAVLAILIITFFLRNLKSTFVVALSIPISIISTFSLLYFFNFTINTISLSGLALATGLIVDDAIVVLENIYRHIERHRSSTYVASITGTDEIFSAVLASTFTVMIVFLPLFLVGGQSGQIFTQFALVVIFSIAISLLDATTIVPMLATRMISMRDVIEEAHPEERDPSRVNWMTRLFDRAGAMFESMDLAYHGGLKWALRHRLWIVGIGVVSIAAAGFLWPLVGQEQLPQSDSGNISVRLKLPIGTTVDDTDVAMRKIEQILLKNPDVEAVLSAAGGNVGLRGVGGGVPQEGSASIQLKENRKHKTQDVIKTLQKSLNVIPGGRVLVQPFDIVQMILGNNVGWSVDVYGSDLGQLTQTCQQIRTTLSGVAGLQNVDLSVQDALPEIHWSVDRAKAQQLGVSYQDIAGAISTATNGQLATYFQSNGFQYPIYVEMPRKLRLSLDQLSRIPISKSSNGQTIYLSQLAKPLLSYGPNQITRQNRQRYINVGGSIQDRSQGEVQADALAALGKLKMPQGVYYTLSAQILQTNKDYSGIGLAVFLAVALIYMLLAAQFESFIYPLVVLTSVPLCAIGLVLALFLTNRSFGLTAFIGLLMLIGIVVKNGILLVDYTNQLRSRGVPREEAILTAGPTRLRPILMTSLAAILGMLPLALGIGSGSEMYVPLATAVMGGLATSTLLTLFVVPTMYTFFDDWGGRFKKPSDGVTDASHGTNGVSTAVEKPAVTGGKDG